MKNIETPKDNRMHKCSICDREFFAPVAELWTYKYMYNSKKDKNTNHITWFCSYTCYREADKKRAPKTDGQWATRRR